TDTDTKTSNTNTLILTLTANNSAYCDFMMTNRSLNSDNCKPRNTFINDNPDVIANVCQGDGTPYGNFTDSKLHFSMVDCNYTGGSYPKCKHGYPVHLEAILSQKDATFTKFAPAFSFTASLLCIYISRGV
uniref:Ribonuclease A-domain domain-containing protein n=1 Tax=Salvator merianae TaxID=96440 RepID=A0A8D0BBI0_SALMN